MPDPTQVQDPARADLAPSGNADDPAARLGPATQDDAQLTPSTTGDDDSATADQPDPDAAPDDNVDEPQVPAYATPREDGTYLSPEELLDHDDFKPLLEERVKAAAEPEGERIAEERFTEYRRHIDETFATRLEEAKAATENNASIQTILRATQDITDSLDVIESEGTLDAKQMVQLRRRFDETFGKVLPHLEALQARYQNALTAAGQPHTELLNALYDNLPETVRKELEAFGTALAERVEKQFLGGKEARAKLVKERDRLLMAHAMSSEGERLKKLAVENAGIEGRVQGRRDGGKPPAGGGPAGGGGGLKPLTVEEAKSLPIDKLRQRLAR